MVAQDQGHGRWDSDLHEGHRDGHVEVIVGRELRRAVVGLQAVAKRCHFGRKSHRTTRDFSRNFWKKTCQSMFSSDFSFNLYTLSIYN